jgi:hypothetical protein
MKKRIVLHLALLASAAAIFTATAVAKFSGGSTAENQAEIPVSPTLLTP